MMGLRSWLLLDGLGVSNLSILRFGVLIRILGVSRGPRGWWRPNVGYRHGRWAGLPGTAVYVVLEPVPSEVALLSILEVF